MSALQGIRVVEMAGLAPAPFCGMILADFGADVVRVDRVGAGSMDQLARGKRSVAVNLKSPEGVETVLRLIEQADVLLEPYRPGVMERLGLGPDVACARNPRLVYARLTGFGQDGPYANMAGHDINYIAISGALSLLGRKGEKPLPPVNLLGDFAGGGMLCALGICLALLERGALRPGPGGRRGDGRRRRLPRAPSSTSSATPACGATSAAPTCSTAARRSTTPTGPRTAQFMSVGAIEPQFYAALLQGLGLDAAAMPHQMDQSKWAATAARFSRHLRRQDARRVVRDLRRHRRLRRAGARPRRGARRTRTTGPAGC